MKSLIKNILPIFVMSILIGIVFAFVGCSPTNNLDDGKDNENETPVETVVEISSFDGATIDGEKISMFIEHDIESVPLSGKVQVSKGCTWKLYSDKLGRNEIPTKVAANNSGELLDGDNQFYIFVSSNTEDKINFYELTIHRSYEVEITYWFNDEIYKTEKVYTGHAATLSDFNVEHYQLNYWQDKEKNKIERPIMWDNLTLYANATYLRKTITLEMNLENAGEIAGGGDFYEGETVQITATTYLGYEFIGWFIGDNKISANKTHSFVVENENLKLIANFVVDNNLTNCIISSDTQTCEIVGVKNKDIVELIIPDYVTTLGDYAFANCSSLTKVTIGKSLIQIGWTVFNNCTSINEVYYTGTLEEWCSRYLQNVGVMYKLYIENELIEHLTIPDTIKKLPSLASCSSLKEVEIKSNNIEIHYGAFKDCQNLISVKFSNTLSKLPNSLFENCTSLQSVTLPNGLTSTGDKTFYNCTSLKEIDLGSSLRRIGNSTFAQSGVKNITIPASVNYIDVCAFYNSSLQTAVFKDTADWKCARVSSSYIRYPQSSTLANSYSAASLLRSEYSDCYWYQGNIY